ncbi:predicted protein [Naegleria gruberi]|uniref:Predicted protein n=1 Tax=Naegleria gruberi TaxID=5762 RepID=D2W0C9_NAEGR|nr:uncharacterized protein NAEGRDRAFT_53695 [Naegleria gruberi]EFC37452.1 predicted protein [Naegleria gruberi]|eukprot:XP_002670196.1 predicted protein [Naegleria gruberi strain NEG-M]
MIPNNSEDLLVSRKVPPSSSIQEEITIEESKTSTPIEIVDEDPFERTIHVERNTPPPLHRRPSHGNSTTSSIIHPTTKPDPIYGRRNTVFTFEESRHGEEHLRHMPETQENKKPRMYNCSRGLRISHVLLVLFIIQGLIGLIPSFILMYTSGNSVLLRVSRFQAQQTQSYVTFEIGKIINTSNLIIQQVKMEVENGFPLKNITEWAIFLKYLRSVYIHKSPLTTIQYGNYLRNYAGTLDISTPYVLLINGTGTAMYYYHISENPFENPLKDNLFLFVEPFKNITQACKTGKSIDSIDISITNFKHKDHLFGAVAEVFALKGLNSFLNSTSRSYNFISYSFIMETNGNVIASSRYNTTKFTVHTGDGEIFEIANYIQDKELLKNITSNVPISLKYRGKNVVITPVVDPYGLSLALVIGSVDADIFAEILSSGMTSVVVFIVILVAGTLCLFVIVQLFTQPLNHVHKKLSKILSDKSLASESDNTKITTAGQIFYDIGEMENGINSLKRGVSAFSKFVSPTIMKKVISDEHYLDVGLTLQNMTILVSSIKDFTQLAELTETSIFVSVMTDYFGSLTKAMEDHRGLIDMINGDRLQAVWNDSSMPVEEHEVRACKAAMEALEIIDELNIMWRNERQIDIDLSIYVSVSSGNMMYGSMGSENRLNFTAIGDDVNIGSKLQSLNRYYGSNILISENTYQHVKNEFVCYFADYILLKGKETPTRIYSLESARTDATDLQIKVSKDLELAQDYMFQNNYRAMYDICERLSLITPCKIVSNLLRKSKRKIDAK